MKNKEVNCIKVINAADPADFESRYNSALLEIMANPYLDHFSEPVTTIDTNKPYLCYVQYKLNVREPESIEEHFTQAGVCFQCADCMHLTTFDDKRKKRGYCSLYKTDVRIYGAACEMLYRRIVEKEKVLTTIAQIKSGMAAPITTTGAELQDTKL